MNKSWVQADFIMEIRKYLYLSNNKEYYKSCGMEPKKFLTNKSSV